MLAETNEFPIMLLKACGFPTILAGADRFPTMLSKTYGFPIMGADGCLTMSMS